MTWHCRYCNRAFEREAGSRRCYCSALCRSYGAQTRRQRKREAAIERLRAQAHGEEAGRE